MAKLRLIVKQIIVITILLTLLTGAIYSYVFYTNLTKAQPKNVIDPKTLVDTGLIYYDNLSVVSPDYNYISFVTSEDIGMTNTIIWLARNDGSEKVKVASSNDLKYVSNPTFSPDSKRLAYMRIYPFEVWIYDIETKTSTNIKPEINDLINYFSPSLGYGGQTYFTWRSNDEIGFEDTRKRPYTRYAININTKIIRTDKASQSPPIEVSNVIPKVTHYSQRDSEWGDDQLGACSNQTIHSAGCAMTSVAMLLSFYGYETTPGEFNEMLSQKNAFGYVEECDIKWYIVPNFFRGLRMVGAYFNEKNYDRIDYELERGNPVIVGFNRVEFTNLQHWVVVTHKVGNKYFIANPWSLTGEEPETLDELGEMFDHLIVYEKDPEYYVYN
jgi:hypothetical protein